MGEYTGNNVEKKSQHLNLSPGHENGLFRYIKVKESSGQKKIDETVFYDTGTEKRQHSDRKRFKIERLTAIFNETYVLK